MPPFPADRTTAQNRHAGTRGRWYRRAERLLLLIAFVTLGAYAYTAAEAFLYQTFENRALDAILAHHPLSDRRSSGDTSKGVKAIAQPGPGSTLGRIEIPRLGMSAIVRAGSDARTLSLAVGHVPGTALPGERGNVGLAAHRDTFFRRLDTLRPDDEIRMVTTEGTLVYRVQRMDVVRPADVWVLDPTESPVLTLITCYPFTYLGAAPDRFVVRATLDERPLHAAR
jgi:sortase A